MTGIRNGLVLFAHGARDPRWAEPFERLRERVTTRVAPAPVVLAFLELMKPSLDEATDALVADGCAHLTIVPVFFGQGSHLRRDLPRLVDTLRARLPQATIIVAQAVGEDETVLDAIADYCGRQAAA